MPFHVNATVLQLAIFEENTHLNFIIFSTVFRRLMRSLKVTICFAVVISLVMHRIVAILCQVASLGKKTIYGNAEILKSSGPHKSTWQTNKALTSLLLRELLRLEKHPGILCLITILVKWCLLALQCHLVLESMRSPERDKGYLPLIKNKKVAILFVQLTGMHYLESQLGGFVFC